MWGTIDIMSHSLVSTGAELQAARRIMEGEADYAHGLHPDFGFRPW